MRPVLMPPVRRLLSRTIAHPGARKAPAGRWSAAIVALGLLPLTLACSTAPAEVEEWAVELALDLEIGADPVTAETAFYQPRAIGLDGAGNVYILDSRNHRVQVFDPGGSYIRSLGEGGVGPGQVNAPLEMHVATDGRVWVADTRNRRLQPYAADGKPANPISLDFFPLGLVVAEDRIFVLRMPAPQFPRLSDADTSPVLRILDHAGSPIGDAVPVVSSESPLLALLDGMYAMSLAPGGGVALAHMRFSSRIRLVDAHGEDAGEIPVLYKAGAWAPLEWLPPDSNDASSDPIREAMNERIAQTARDLAWDSRRELFWVLAGYVAQAPDGEWIRGVEAYRYAVDGSYQGTAALPQQAMAIAAGPDGRVWTIDREGVVRAFRVIAPGTDDS